MGLKLGVLILFIIGALGFVSAADPTGPSWMNVTANETWAGEVNGAMVNTSGGVLSKIDVEATVQNPHWKAFVGWIDGKFTLDDSADETIYDWTLSSIGGQVYATRASGNIDWANIGCATSGEIDVEDGSLNHDGEDNISSTFNDTNTGTYSVAGFAVGAGDCFAANTYIGNVSQGASFEEFVLEDDSANIVFATEIEDEVVGFDGVSYDFQMIVPEDGDDGFTGSTSYYLYVELN